MNGTGTFRVLDVHDGPHGGMILRLRLQEGDAPSLKTVKSSTLVAEGPDGESTRFEVTGLAVFGGKQSDARLARTGRVDVHVRALDEGGPRPRLRWNVRLT